jgi:hypothetical protein
MNMQSAWISETLYYIRLHGVTFSKTVVLTMRGSSEKFVWKGVLRIFGPKRDEVTGE